HPMKDGKRLALALAVLALALAIVAAVYMVAEHQMRREVHGAGARQLQIIALDLESLLERYESLPSALAFHPDLARLLANPADEALKHELNLELQLIERQSKVSDIYLMDRNGNTLVSSNWDAPLSFVGRNFSYHPYFREAIAGGAGHFYGVGSVTSQPAYFIARPVYPDNAARHHEQPIGAIVVRISLSEFEQSWHS